MSIQDSTSEIGTAPRISVFGEADLRELVSKALNGCSKRINRQQVAEQLSTPAHTITKRMLDDWATPSKKGLRVPAFLIKPLCEITGDHALAMSVLPYRMVFLVALDEWVYQSRRTLERIHQDLLKLTGEQDRKPRKSKKSNRPRKA
jgi:hypothetical protein